MCLSFSIFFLDVPLNIFVFLGSVGYVMKPSTFNYYCLYILPGLKF